MIFPVDRSQLSVIYPGTGSLHAIIMMKNTSCGKSTYIVMLQHSARATDIDFMTKHTITIITHKPLSHMPTSSGGLSKVSQQL